MKSGRRTQSRLRTLCDPDRDNALESMTADELREFVRDALEQLDDELRGRLVDCLIAHAAKGNAKWKPSSPAKRVVDEVKDFTSAARRLGYADSHEVDDYLRQGTKAFLAGEHATARALFELLLPPLADGEIHLGQHEMIDEVLAVNAHECAAQYVASVYVTTPLVDRAEALSEAINTVHGIASFWTPLEQMERVATEPLPELDAFLPLWVKHLEQEPTPDGEWEWDCDRWLREAVLRLEGVSGLEQIARKTKKPEALSAWCTALTDNGEWAEALRAYDIAVDLVGESHWRGDFLDGAALAARRLERRDQTKRLEAAWFGAPSLVRLLRWLGAGTPTAATVVKRTKKAIAHCPTRAGRQLGLLHVLARDVAAAAKLLAKAPGLGWSSENHPGHVLFPAFAGLLAVGTEATLSSELFAGLEEAPSDPLDMDWHNGDEAKPATVSAAKPKFTTSSIMELFEVVCPGLKIDSGDRVAMLKAMRAAATKRVEGILGNKRRRYYGHAAILIACCLELAPSVGEQKVVADWVDDVREKYSRFSAFQGELKDAFALASMSS